ncbi:carboxypeptidase-like regulatory domain-containing protein [Pseudoalteromonas sp. OOF1S-7]|uniref:carboxypeptidase-like regulatory domain-containing protein n=1 Tax=Pseudoalteromonas sp. OOF1S-7 TaxID=2917757 RepID=UPI001EF71C39|nr:carboxypeptidase-like regulatory domain-containing protein [Pseudoalteromonas sp. OOF1S-7]MCG7534641.1 carboxypeptidase-like regulatory domain-containing protein [Pseudoalteromonas sp. OOF1S-7]
MQYLYVLLLLLSLHCTHTSAREVGDTADFVFADLYVDQQNFPEGSELLTHDYEHYFLSQDNLNALLVSDLTIDLADKRLHGAIWGEQVEIKLEEDQWVTLDEEPHIRLDVLLALGIESEFNPRTQVLVFDTQQRHPSSQEKKREARKDILEAMQRKRANQLVLNDQYQWYTAPYIDVQLSASDSKHNSSASAYVALNQDLAHHQAQVILTDSDNDKRNGRFQLSRSLGELSEYQFGDLQGITGALLQTGGSGLGVQYGATHSSASKPLIIQGYAEPGSDVELYRNDVLFDLVRVTDNGQYRFRPIQIFNSNHSYHLMIQSPDGKRLRRAVMHQAQSGYEPGQWYTNLAAYTTKESILKKSRFNPQEKYLNPQLNYVVSTRDEINVGGEWLENTRQKDALWYLGWEHSGEPTDAKWSLKAGGHEQLYYDLKWLTPLSTSQALSLASQRGYGQFGKENINTLNYEHTLDSWQISSTLGLSQINQSRYKSVDGYLSFQADSGSISTNFSQIRGDDAHEQQYAMIGSLFGNWGRARFNWNKSTGLFEQHSLALSYANQFDGYYGSLQLRRSFTHHRNTTSFTLSKTFDAVAVNASATYHESNGWQFGLSCSFSFYGPRPLSTLSSQSGRQSSSVKLRAFYDRNNNQRFDEQEQYLPGITVMMNGSQVDTLTQAQAQTLLHLPSNRPVTLEIEHNEPDALYLQPQFGLIEADLHPGSQPIIDVPFQLQFEAEGVISLLKDSGALADLSGRVALQLTRETSGEQTTIYTEPDGFFFFDKLKQGKYRLEVSPHYLAQKALNCDPCQLSFTLDEHSEQLVILEDLTLYPTPPGDPKS